MNGGRAIEARNRWAAAAILVVAAVLRLPLLEHRPMHADEAILADKFGTLLATGAYPYDPHEYHGPMLARLAWISAHLAGRTTYATLSETVLRLAPAAAGILLALAPLLLTPLIGAPAASTAAALVAVSPAMVYYSRYFIPEMLLALATALFLAALTWRGRAWSLAAGAAAAFMIATKETAVLALAAAGLAYLAAFRPRPDWRGVALFLAALAAGVSVLLAPPWRWAVLAEAAASYLQRAVGGPHVHGWYAYLQWLTGWGYRFSEAPIMLLAAAGMVAAWRSAKPTHRFLVFYTTLLAAFYFVVPYKTPWCAVSLLYALALTAGVAADALGRTRRIVVGGALACLAVQAWLAAVTYSADPSNPWAYAHTGPGVFTIRDRVLEFARASPDGRRVAIDIYSGENLWPLPWYFRGMPNVRWWRHVPVAGPAAPIVLVSPAMETDLARRLYEGQPAGERELYMNLFPAYVELRPRIEVRGYVAKSLWDQREREK
jgi:predicted membrane-bound mannosyltransferase